MTRSFATLLLSISVLLVGCVGGGGSSISGNFVLPGAQVEGGVHGITFDGKGNLRAGALGEVFGYVAGGSVTAFTEIQGPTLQFAEAAPAFTP